MTTAVTWTETYRPRTLDDVVGHSDHVAALRHIADEQRVAHLLFEGPPGSGKTSTLFAFLAHLFRDVPHWYKRHVLKLDASTDRGIDVIRSTVATFCDTIVASSPVKVVVLDEADGLTVDAQDALNLLLESKLDPSRRIMFCLLCNAVHKLTPAVRSRLTCFRFNAVGPDMMVAHMRRVLALATPGSREFYDNDDVLGCIAHKADGDVRKALRLLENVVTARHPEVVLATPPADALWHVLCTPVPSFDAACRALQRWYAANSHWDLVDVLRELMRFEHPDHAARLRVAVTASTVENSLRRGCTPMLWLLKFARHVPMGPRP